MLYLPTNQVEGYIGLSILRSAAAIMRSLLVLPSLMRKPVEKWNSEVEIFPVDDVTLLQIVRRRYRLMFPVSTRIGTWMTMNGGKSST